MTSLANLPTCIPNLTDQITKTKSDPLVVSGRFWDVWKCLWTLPSGSSPVAVKVLKAPKTELDDSVRREMKVWGRLQHQHILPLLGLVYDFSPLPGFVSPWMTNGNLVQYLDSHSISRYEGFCLLQDVASAVQYLHSIAVIHGDLTGNNILVDSRGRAVVTDVGVSTLLDEITESEHGKTTYGTIRYMAPELVVENPNRLPTSKSDVWSFGCNMIHVLSGKLPWSNIPDGDIIYRLLQNHAPPSPREIKKQRHLSFLQQCFSLGPADRPSADQVLAFVHGELCKNRMPRSAEATQNSHCGIPDVMTEFKRRVSDQIPSHLIYVPKMRLVSRDELAAILKPEMVTEEDISRCGGWSRQSTIESTLVPNMLKYAILSHRWGESEPTFQDLRSKKCKGAGYKKLQEFCTKAKKYGCDFAWSDTCCINKESSSELDEAIRSMYRWYRDAYICIVHLAQSESLETLDIDEWFTRGWTLQELLAPQRMKFYGPNWTPLTHNKNDKDDATFVFALSRVSKIPPNDLYNFRPGPNRAWEKMTWAAGRKTTRIEDVAYSLSGIFDITMTIAYGEGDRAFKRFITELIQNCKEWQILVWAGGLPGSPTEPACYRTSDDVALDVLKKRQISWWGEDSGDSDFSVTKRGVQVKLLVVPVSVDENAGKWTFLFQPADGPEASPLEKLVVLSRYFPPASTTEWAIGIVNYHHHDGDKGRLKREEKYMCFLLRRLSRPGTNVIQDHWRREVTEEILTISCAHDFDQLLETVWL